MQISLISPPENISPYCWLVKLGGNKLGIHKVFGWCMQLTERVIYFDSESMCMPLLPILEMKVNDFKEFIRGASELNPDYVESIRLFPKVALLKYVFHSSSSGYWPEKALAWLDGDNDLYPQFRIELDELVKNKVMYQGSRQKAKKILSEIQRNNSRTHLA